MISRPTEGLGRFNVFQRLMYQWSELHPYNAVHIYKLGRSLQPVALHEAVRQTYLANGIGLAEVDGDGASYRHRTDHAPEIVIAPQSHDAEFDLTRHIASELNRGFERPQCRPWRFSAIEAGHDAHYVVLTYDHWVADSSAARLVMRHVLDRYCGWNRSANRPCLNLYPGTYREVFPHQLGAGRLLGAAAQTMRQLVGQRRVAYVPYSSSRHMAVGFDLYRTSPHTVEQLRHFSRSQGATVHDVILAALGLALADFLPKRITRAGRSLSLGSIVDTRAEASDDLSDTLGTFLGYYLVKIACGSPTSLADATKCVAAASAPIKARRAYFNSLVSMKAASTVWPRLTKSVQPHFFRKVMPLTGGVSNLVVRDPWLKQSGDILEYVRGASTGPMLPLVLTPTTFDDTMTIGVTYRLAGFSQPKIDGIMNGILERLESPYGHHRHRAGRRQQPATGVDVGTICLERREQLAAAG